MAEFPICLGTSHEFESPVLEQVKLFHEIGFDGFFTDWSWSRKEIPKLRELSDDLGIAFQSVHAPFRRAADMWRGDESAEAAVKELICCAEDCAMYGIPLMVCHAFIGFKDHNPTPHGPVNYGKVVERAGELGVKIAFENTEGEEYLSALMESFRGIPYVGFCLDTGHEQCYNRGKDMLALYGDRLFCTHLNDNMGVSGPDISTRDDLHLIPFDGTIDWEGTARRLVRHGYSDYLTFEIRKRSKPNRTENDVYTKMPIKDFAQKIHLHALRFAETVKRQSEMIKE